LILNNPFPKTPKGESGLKSGLNTPNSKAETPNVSRSSATNDSLLKEVDKPKTNSVAENLADKLKDVLNDHKKSESKPNACNHVCPRLMEGTCPHGVSGKKTAEGKEKCELFHPKRCYKYMSYYTHAKLKAALKVTIVTHCMSTFANHQSRLRNVTMWLAKQCT
jgi:hypothetical protein